MTLPSPGGWMPQFTAGYAKLATQNPTRLAAPPADLSDLPVIEIAAQPGAVPTANAPPDSFAIIMSGDGGWAGLDQDVAAALSAKGIPVVGWTPCAITGRRAPRTALRRTPTG